MTSAHRALFPVFRSGPGAILERWAERYRHSPLRFPAREPDAGAENLGAPIVESLAEALGSSPERGEVALEPGSPLVREVEKSAAFAGAALGAAGASGYDVAALVLAVRDALAGDVAEARAELYRFFEWLGIVALDSFAAAKDHAARERVRDELERGTPVVLLPGEIPGAFLVGHADAVVLEAVFGRLLLSIVRVGAPAVVIDAGGLANPTRPEVVRALGELLGHEHIRGRVLVVATGLDPEQAAAWREVADRAETTLEVADRTDDAVSRALRRAGWRLAPAG